MQRLIWNGCLGLTVALTLTGCATMRVNSYLERGADVRYYRTYAWAPAESFSTGDARLDNNRFFIERVQAAVERELAPRGMAKAAFGTSDVILHYHARLHQQLEVNDRDAIGGRCEGTGCGPFVYEAGTLLIDVVDARTNRLAWRGWAERSLDGVIDDQEWMNKTIDDAVGRIIARLPRGLSQTQGDLR
jgi:hypothetical protein